jgi:hypothetical protein
MQRSDKRKYHYIYRTTCSITNKFYIGMHSTDDLNDGYVGSGKLLWYSIRKYGKENHTTMIVEYLPTRHDLKVRETELVNENLLSNSLCMNLKLGGEGGGNFDHISIAERSANGKKGGSALSNRLKSDVEFAAEFQIKIADIQRKAFEDGKLKTFIDAKSFEGKKHSVESIEKMRLKKLIADNKGEANSQYGTCWIHSIVESKNQKIQKINLDEWLLLGWVKGRKMK